MIRFTQFRYVLSAVVVSALAGAAVVAAATVGLGRATHFRASFTTQRSGTPSGLTLRTSGRPPASGTSEAPAVRQTVILPVGTQLRLGRLPQCRASAAAIAAQGAEVVCPRRSRVGRGAADGRLDGAPVHFDLGIYAVRGHLVLAAEQHGVPLKQAFDGFARGRMLALTVPTLGGRIAPTGFFARIPAHPSGRTWLVTPARCPTAGDWLATGRFQGVSAASPGAAPVTPAQTLHDREPCR